MTATDRPPALATLDPEGRPADLYPPTSADLALWEQVWKERRELPPERIDSLFRMAWRVVAVSAALAQEQEDAEREGERADELVDELIDERNKLERERDRARSDCDDLTDRYRELEATRDRALARAERLEAERNAAVDRAAESRAMLRSLRADLDEAKALLADPS